MYGRTGGLERFKKAQTLQPFAVAAKQTLRSDSESIPSNNPNQHLVSKDDVVVATTSQVGGGESSWQPPDWAIEPRHGVYYLDVFKDGDLLDRIHLDKRRHIFGRQLHTCDFVLDHQSVSRQHAAVVPHKNGSIYVIDLGSAHGTFVANERLTKDSPVELEVGQSLRFAASTRVYILKKDNAALFPTQPRTITLPPPPDPSDEEAVLAYNTYLNRYNNNNNNNDQSQAILRPVKRRKKSRVSFRDQVGGELVEVVGVSDGADVETEPGPIGVKEGSSLVGKYESLVQTTVIPRGGAGVGVGGKMESPKGGVTDKLQQVLNRVKASSKGIYDGLYGESLSSTTKAASSWAYSGSKEEEKSPAAATAASASASDSKRENNIDNSDDDDDLFG